MNHSLFCSREEKLKNTVQTYFSNSSSALFFLCSRGGAQISEPPQRLLLQALLLNKIIVLESVRVLFSCGPYNHHQHLTQ